MKRLFCILTVFTAVISYCTAAVYSVKDIPNVHLSSRTRYVSNPDGILTSATEIRLDSMLADVWRSSSAETVVVAVNDVDPDMDTDDFATALFEEWKIGKKDKDNGLLVLIVKDRRKAVIRTGYGMEGTVPDILAGKIIRNDMAPHFKSGDYDTGTLQAVSHLAQVITDPEVRDELMSQYDNDADALKQNNGDDMFRHYVTLSMIITALIAAVFIIMLIRCTRLDRYHAYMTLHSMQTLTLILSLICLGMPFIVFIPLKLMLHHLRRGKRMCPNCRHRMTLIDEENDNKYLTPSQDMEEKINSVDYDVWLCPQCRTTEILPYVNKASGYEECPNCHGRTARMLSDVITVQPSTAHEGVGTKTYECTNCRNRFYRKYKIEKLAPVVIVGGGGGRGGFGGGGGFSGGSFGGGMTGGGGASGGW